MFPSNAERHDNVNNTSAIEMPPERIAAKREDVDACRAKI